MREQKKAGLLNYVFNIPAHLTVPNYPKSDGNMKEGKMEE